MNKKNSPRAFLVRSTSGQQAFTVIREAIRKEGMGCNRERRLSSYDRYLVLVSLPSERQS
jgi:hypothetical protein